VLQILEAGQPADDFGFFLLDIIWLGVVAKCFYRNNLGFVLTPRLATISAFQKTVGRS